MRLGAPPQGCNWRSPWYESGMSHRGPVVVLLALVGGAAGCTPPGTTSGKPVDWGGDSADRNPGHGGDSAEDSGPADCAGEPCSAYYADSDGDGYGNPDATACLCEASTDYPASTATDCDDANSEVNPDAGETCDLIDNNCQGGVDEGFPTYPYYTDADGDGDGAEGSAAATEACREPPGYSYQARDCDDADPDVNSLEDERCGDGLDNDCAGDGDEPCDPMDRGVLYTNDTTGGYYAGSLVRGLGDVDGDGFADFATSDQADSEAATFAGAVFLLLGRASPVSGGLSGEIKILGERDTDLMGYGLSAGGDVDGDGYDDLWVAAPYRDEAHGDEGRVWLLQGSPSPASTSLAGAPTWAGELRGGMAGAALGGGGDVNGDGLADGLIGVTGSGTGRPGAGGVYVIFGSASPTSGSITEGVLLFPEQADDAAQVPAWVGDTDGDGVDDLVVGAKGVDEGEVDAGRAYLVLGEAGFASSKLADAVAYDAGRRGESAGVKVSAGGDINGDGLADFLVGSSYAVYLVLGNARPTSGSLSASAALYPEGASFTPWPAVGGAGDPDADGFDDVLVGEGQRSTTSIEQGAAYIVRGSAVPASEAVTDGEAFYGVSPGDYLGFSVDGVGDFDGDGTDDVAFGAQRIGSSGGVYLMQGSAL